MLFKYSSTIQPPIETGWRNLNSCLHSIFVSYFCKYFSDWHCLWKLWLWFCIFWAFNLNPFRFCMSANQFWLNIKREAIHLSPKCSQFFILFKIFLEIKLHQMHLNGNRKIAKKKLKTASNFSCK